MKEKKFGKAGGGEATRGEKEEKTVGVGSRITQKGGGKWSKRKEAGRGCARQREEESNAKNSPVLRTTAVKEE